MTDQFEQTNHQIPNPDQNTKPGWFVAFWKFLPTLTVLLLVLVIAIMYTQIKAKEKITKENKAKEMVVSTPTTNVIAMELVPRPVKDSISLPGVVKPWISLKVVAEVRGKIIEKEISEGRHVQKGDILAKIDPDDYTNQYNSAMANYETAVASLKRLQALGQDQLSTQSQIDDASARVKTSKAAMDNAKLNLDRCTIRSPMSGVVDRIFIENGQFMNPADPVAEILQIDKVKVSVGIPESDVDAVRNLETFYVTIDALGGTKFEGHRHYLYKTTESLARLYNLEIEVDNPSQEILPDMFARVEIVKKKIENGLSVPLYAVVTKDDTNAVYVVDDDVAHIRPVKVGIQEGWKVEISNGLSAGDKVVVVGQRIINDGAHVNVTRTVSRMEELTQ